MDRRRRGSGRSPANRDRDLGHLRYRRDREDRARGALGAPCPGSVPGWTALRQSARLRSELPSGGSDRRLAGLLVHVGRRPGAGTERSRRHGRDLSQPPRRPPDDRGARQRAGHRAGRRAAPRVAGQRDAGDQPQSDARPGRHDRCPGSHARSAAGPGRAPGARRSSRRATPRSRADVGRGSRGRLWRPADRADHHRSARSHRARPCVIGAGQRAVGRGQPAQRLDNNRSERRRTKCLRTVLSIADRGGRSHVRGDRA